MLRYAEYEGVCNGRVYCGTNRHQAASYQRLFDGRIWRQGVLIVRVTYRRVTYEGEPFIHDLIQSGWQRASGNIQA